MERGIGQLKRRFHVLHSEVRISPPFKIGKMIHVCGMFHTICKDRNIPIPLDVDQPDVEDDVAIQQPEDMQVVPPLVSRYILQLAFQVRWIFCICTFFLFNLGNVHFSRICINLNQYYFETT